MQWKQMETSVAKQQNFILFFQKFLRKGCHFQTQISQLLIGQIEKFWCLSDREFPEFFKTHPTFVPSHFQSGVISKMPRTCVFFGTPCIYLSLVLLIPTCVKIKVAQSCLSRIVVSGSYLGHLCPVSWSLVQYNRFTAVSCCRLQPCTSGRQSDPAW